MEICIISSGAVSLSTIEVNTALQIPVFGGVWLYHCSANDAPQQGPGVTVLPSCDAAKVDRSSSDPESLQQQKHRVSGNAVKTTSL
jgi:hypothetical protein